MPIGGTVPIPKMLIVAGTAPEPRVADISMVLTGGVPEPRTPVVAAIVGGGAPEPRHDTGGSLSAPFSWLIAHPAYLILAGAIALNVFLDWILRRRARRS